MELVTTHTNIGLRYIPQFILFFRISIDPHKSTRVLYRIRSALQTLSTLTVLTFHFHTIVVDHRATDRKQDRIVDVRRGRRHQARTEN